MGTPILGVGGGIYNGANRVLNIKTWALTIKADTTDTISFGSAGGWNTKISTFKDWSASGDGNTDATDTTGQLAFINGLGNTFTLKFNVSGTATDGHWDGTGILVGVNPKSDAAGMNEVSYSFEGTGALTFSTS